jgi:hypothetical protein
VHINTFIHPDGTEEFLMNRADELYGIVSEYTLHDIDGIFQQVAGDVDFSMALNDMTDAITRPRTTAVCCARTLDTIKNLLAPDLRGKQGWRVVQEALRADESYLQHISTASSSSRHGKHEFLPVEEAEEILRRTWILVDRYFYLRLHSQKELPVDKFPLLSTALRSRCDERGAPE